VDRHRLGHADGVGELDLAAIGEAGGDDVLGDVAGHVGGGAVDLGRVLAREGAAAVAAHAAVGVDDDLAAGEARVAVGAAEDELAGRVDVDGDVLVDQSPGRALMIGSMTSFFRSACFSFQSTGRAGWRGRRCRRGRACRRRRTRR
jgi:hypothetical protein